MVYLILRTNSILTLCVISACSSLYYRYVHGYQLLQVFLGISSLYFLIILTIYSGIMKMHWKEKEKIILPIAINLKLYYMYILFIY